MHSSTALNAHARGRARGESGRIWEICTGRIWEICGFSQPLGRMWQMATGALPQLKATATQGVRSCRPQCRRTSTVPCNGWTPPTMYASAAKVSSGNLGPRPRHKLVSFLFVPGLPLEPYLTLRCTSSPDLPRRTVAAGARAVSRGTPRPWSASCARIMRTHHTFNTCILHDLCFCALRSVTSNPNISNTRSRYGVHGTRMRAQGWRTA